MITVKAKDLKNPNFIGGMQKMAHFPFKKAQVGMHVATTIDEVQKKSQSLQDKFVNLIKMYGDVDAAGQYKIKEENMETWQKAATEFDEQDVELPGYKVDLSDLDGAGLSPVELIACKPVILNLEVVS